MRSDEEGALALSEASPPPDSGRGAAPVPPAAPPAPLSRRLLDAGLKTALVTVGVVAVAAWLFIALTQLDDRHGISHVQGAWIVLADYANDGVLYPPLYDGERYGGTRWMPIPILLHAGVARLTGEYVVSGKALGVGLTSALLALALLVLRRSRCPWPLALALVGTIVATAAGRAVGSTLGGDVLPVLLQVGALALFDRGQHRTRTGAAGLLAGLAFASKLSGVWAALAVLTWLGVNRRWRSLVEFTVAAAAAAGVVLGTVYVASDGRIVESMLQLTGAGVGVTGSPLRPFNQLLTQLPEYALATWALLPVAVAGIALAGGWRRITVHQLALGWASIVVLGVFTDVGAGFNHLFDVVVLTAIVVGQVAGQLADDGPSRRAVLAAVAVFVVWAGGSGIVNVLAPDLRAAVVSASAQTDRLQPLSGVVTPGDSLLSEDPYVPFSLGQEPVVLDPFMLRRLDAARPDDVDDLIDRIERQEFDHVVLVNPLDEPDEFWWTAFHFGPRVMAAIQSAYEPSGRVEGYFIHRPRG